MAKETEIEKTALELSGETAQKCGVYVVDTEYAKNDDGNYSLTFYIDTDGGVGIDKCEEFSRAVEEVLDVRDIIDSNYVLEVSSPGLDRTLKKEREFRYYIGREVDVKLYGALNGVKEFTGTLTGFDGGEAEIEYGGDTVKIAPDKAVYIKLSFKI